MHLNPTSLLIEFKRVDQQGTSYAIGCHRKDTKIKHGVARVVSKWGTVNEGMYRNDLLNGFARVIYGDGNIYEGMFKNGKKDGFGRTIKPDGNIVEGFWKADIF